VICKCVSDASIQPYNGLDVLVGVSRIMMTPGRRECRQRTAPGSTGATLLPTAGAHVVVPRFTQPYMDTARSPSWFSC